MSWHPLPDSCRADAIATGWQPVPDIDLDEWNAKLDRWEQAVKPDATSPNFGIHYQEPYKLVFVSLLHESNHAAVYKVRFNGSIRALKVYHTRNPLYIPELGYDRETDFVAEKLAYERIHSRGLQKLCHTPKYYGTLDKLDPTKYIPHLDRFLGDEPYGLLLEYISNLQPLGPSNFTVERGQQLSQASKALHEVGIAHRDLSERHLCIQAKTKRLVIHDFDLSLTLPENKLEQERSWHFQHDCKVLDEYIEDWSVHIAEDRKKYSSSNKYEADKENDAKIAPGNSNPGGLTRAQAF